MKLQNSKYSKYLPLDMLIDFTANMLSPNQRKKVQRHISSCPEDKEIVAGIKHFIRIGGQINDIERLFGQRPLLNFKKQKKQEVSYFDNLEGFSVKKSTLQTIPADIGENDYLLGKNNSPTLSRFKVIEKKLRVEQYQVAHLDYSLEFPYFDEQLWVAIPHLSLIYRVHEKKIIDSISKILTDYNLAETEYCSYFQIKTFENQKTRCKFYRIDLALLIGKSFNTEDFHIFKTWVDVKSNVDKIQKGCDQVSADGFFRDNSSYFETNFNPSKKDGFFIDIAPYFETDVRLTRAEAFVGILLAAATPDGEISENETIDLFSFLLKSKSLKQYSIQEIAAILKKMMNYLKEYGFDSLVDNSVAFYPRSTKMYKLACKIVYSVGQENIPGERLLKDLQIILGLDSIVARQINVITRLKNSV